jgi:hypothetical protein
MRHQDVIVYIVGQLVLLSRASTCLQVSVVSMSKGYSRRTNIRHSSIVIMAQEHEHKQQQILSSTSTCSKLALSRRSILQNSISQMTIAVTGLSILPCTSQAYPMITSDEFDKILRDSARGIGVVEFSGPKSENIKVTLVDGTEFGISGIVESSTDPRSPLKIAARCRENNVRAKFVNYEAALSTVSTTGKKKVAYTNTRVQEAFVKEQEKQERLQQDEQNRLLELYRLQQSEQQ